MIRCQLVHISRNQRGQPIRKELLVAGETIQIGRAAGCKILLPDHRVNLHHAVIRHSDEGKLYIESEEGANIIIDGSFASNAEFTPGTHVFVGPYELVAGERTDDFDLVLSVELVYSMPGSHEHKMARMAPVTIAETGLSKRKAALLLVGIFVITCLLLPLIHALSPALPEWAANRPIFNKEPWQLGDMARGHRLISAKCDICHQQPFQTVPDKACESCHKTVARHVAGKALQARAFGDTNCVDCHHDHRGEKALTTQDMLCVTCHAEIKEKNASTRLANASDFGTDHPSFKLTLKTGHGDSDVVRIPQNEKARLVEKSGLKFSHKVHLDKKGVSSPEGDTILNCRDCHEPDQAGIRHQPVSMKKNCQQSNCHALRFKPPASGRHVPHGSVSDVMVALREYHTTMSIDRISAGEKCGVGSDQIERALNCADNKAAANADALFKSDTGCSECHEIARVEDDSKTQFKVAPVTMTSHWLSNSSFPHRKHSTTKCSECHDKELSEKSSDVAIPAIGKCRECHAGDKQTKNRIASSCNDCHAFHIPHKSAGN